MHFFVLILTILGAAALWWYRIKYIADAGSEAIDAAGKFKGHLRRKKLRSQAEQSPIAAIDNSVIAASTLLFSLTNTAPLPPKQEDVIRNQLSQIAGDEILEEAVVYGRWVQTQPLDKRKAITLLCEKLNDWLSFVERSELVAMINLLDQDKFISTHSPSVELAKQKLQKSDR